jgi:peptide/nickel transport system permease protein
VSVGHIARRVLNALGTLAFVVTFNFFLFRFVNADPVGTLYRGRNVPRERLAELRSEFGLDGSTFEQFLRYVGQTMRGNLGLSYGSRRPVMSEIGDALWPTVLLVGTAAVLSAVIGVALGKRAGWRSGSAFDQTVTGGSMALYSMPDFWLALLLMAVFAQGLGWFPIRGMSDPRSTADGFAALLDTLHHLVLPCATLTLAYVGEYVLLMRTSMVEVKGEDFITLARAKGLRDVLVRDRHAVPNALLPVVTLGQATYEAIRLPDYPMLQGLFLLFSAATIFANLAADLLYALLDPRVGR